VSTNDRDDTKERLLETAGRMFAEKGFRDASVREICQRAGTNLAAVNYHFGDKERLYIESIKRAHMRRAEEVPLPQWPADASAETRLRGFVHTFLTRLLRNRETEWHEQLMMREMLEPSGACTELVRDFIRPNFQILLTLLDELLPPEVDEETRWLIGFGVAGQCLYFRMSAPVVRLLVAPDRYEHYQVDYLTDHITRSTLATIAGFGGRNVERREAIAAH